MIKGPKNAVPTQRGWTHAKTGELLKAQKITQEQIDEWYGVTVQTTAPVVETIEAVVESQDEESIETGTEVVEDIVETQVEDEPTAMGNLIKRSVRRAKKRLSN